MKKKLNWIDTLKSTTGKKISNPLFFTYLSQTQVSLLVFPEHHKRIRKLKKKNKPHITVQRYFKDWEELGFLDSAKKGSVKDKKIKLKILNFNPIYKYCEEKNITFNEHEKSFLKILLLSEHLREKILYESPEEDIINATLKFYIKQYPIFYNMLQSHIREFPKSYFKEKRKLKKLQQQKILIRSFNKTQKEIMKRYGEGIKKPDKVRDWDIFDVIDHSHTTFFSFYKIKRKENPEFIWKLDNKIMKALNLYPVSIRFD